MSNGVPFDRPLMGPTRFDPNSIPPFEVNLPPMLQQLAPVAAAHLLNRAMETAQQSNVARISALNHLVLNNFQNSNYSPMVEMVLRLAAREAFKQNNVPNVKAYIGQAVDSALVFLASSLLASDAIMRQSCPAQTVTAAYQNYQQFSRIKEELDRLDLSVFNQTPQQTQVNYGNPQPTMSTTAPLFDNYSHSYAQAHKPEASPTAATFGSQWSNTAQPAPVAAPAPRQANDVLAQAAWFNNNETARQIAQANTSIPVVDYTSFTEVATVATPAPVVVTQAKSIALSIVTCHGENEMDINNHAIPYFGSSELLVDLSARRADLQLEALQLNREGRRDETASGPILLEPSVMVETNLDSAIFTASVSKAHNLYSGRQNQVYRQFLHILSPIACSEEAKGAMAVFSKAQSLGQLPDLFRSFLKIIRDPSNPQENEQQALNFYAYLDGKLTASLNEFLRYNLRVKIKVGSFCEDYAGLDVYLRNKVSENAAQALMAWSSRFFDQVRSGYNAQADELLREFFSGESKASYGYFPTFQSITLLSLTNKELGYRIDSNGSLVDPKTTGVLDAMTQSLYRNKKDLNFGTSKDWLITSDDSRYRIAEDALNPGKFYVFPG